MAVLKPKNSKMAAIAQAWTVERLLFWLSKSVISLMYNISQIKKYSGKNCIMGNKMVVIVSVLQKCIYIYIVFIELGTY